MYVDSQVKELTVILCFKNELKKIDMTSLLLIIIHITLIIGIIKNITGTYASTNIYNVIIVNWDNINFYSQNVNSCKTI